MAFALNVALLLEVEWVVFVGPVVRKALMAD
jgi:hypothetical protein